MIRNLIGKLFGWKKPDLGHPYEVVRTGRDMFQVSLGQNILKLAAEVGEKKNGKYEVTIFPRTVSPGNQATRASPETVELALKTLEQFLTANGYVLHRG